jgi:polysaccharide pyruvyl transferase WcaK-like protein
MKKVYFSGYYGKKSFGDDLFIYSLVDYFHDDFDIKFLSTPIPDLDSKYFLFKKNSNLKNLLNFFKILFFTNYDFIVFAGGSTYKTKKQFSKRFLIDCFVTRKKIIFGAGIGPFDSKKDQYYFNELFNQYDLIFVRDNASLSISSANKFEQGTDIAHNYIAKNFYNITARRENYIGVSFSTSNYAEEEDFYNHILENICISSAYYLFILNVAESLRDEYWIQKLAVTLSKENVNYKIFSIDEISANNILARMNECSKMYTSRLHAAISAYSMKIPQTCQPYAQKTLSFLKDIGFEGSDNENIIHTKDFRHYDELHGDCSLMYSRLKEHLNEN